MIRVSLLLLALLAPMTAAAQGTLATVPSRHSVADTLARLVKDIEGKGLKVAARIDHAAGAKAAGMELPPTMVVIFGNPKLGTPLIQAHPSIAIDLPMRLLVWQDKAGKVWIGYTPPSTLQARHGVTSEANVAALRTMATALDAIAKAAAN